MKYCHVKRSSVKKELNNAAQYLIDFDENKDDGLQEEGYVMPDLILKPVFSDSSGLRPAPK